MNGSDTLTEGKPLPVQPGVSPRTVQTEKIAPWVWVAIVVFLVVIPVTALFWQSLALPDGGRGVQNYVEVLSRGDIWEAIRNSFVIAFGSTAAALLIAVPFAYLVSRTDLPGRGFFRSVAVLTFAAPGFIAAMGWILLLGPQSGLINQYLFAPLGLPAFNIFSPQGIVFVLAFFLYPLIFLPVADALDNMDTRLEEAAESLGASRLQTLRRITLPLILPPIFSGSLLVFISAFTIFGPVALLGGPVGFQTIPTAMFQLMSFPPRIEYAAVLGLPVIVVLALLVYLQKKLYGRRRYTTVGGKPGLRRQITLGSARWAYFAGGLAVFTISVILPFGVLVLTSFRKAIGLPLTWENFVLWDNYAALLEQDSIARSFFNSMWIAVGATVLSLFIAFLAGWLLERTRWAGRFGVQPMMLAPLAFPGAILGIAMIIAFSGGPWWLGGTLTIMFLAYLIRVVPQSFTYVQAGFKQINVETEEAARSLGASWGETITRVTVPLLRGPLLSVGVLNFVILFRELDVSIFLYTGANEVAPVILYNLASQSQFQVMGALAVVMLLVNLGVVLLARRLFGVKISG
ncbi:iron ABC transporter permease [Arthrobacter sp. Helios]|uniref:ABC transporter permease n=1 Tax=Arthrobacter sp. Helios TaxID=2828862 RepID=UPI00205E0838|nr:iron ABC transporter permease [Arthrobacter sp. Helios]UPO78502.1 iron ABC transporter permease [Arthrobacter sp. Helios]